MFIECDEHLIVCDFQWGPMIYIYIYTVDCGKGCGQVFAQCAVHTKRHHYIAGTLTRKYDGMAENMMLCSSWLMPSSAACMCIHILAMLLAVAYPVMSTVESRE